MIVSICHIILLYHLSMQRLGNLKVSIVYHSAPNTINNIYDTVTLDNSSIIVLVKLALPYISWGLIWDSKNK